MGSAMLGYYNGRSATHVCHIWRALNIGLSQAEKGRNGLDGLCVVLYVSDFFRQSLG
jgi:hypothetical protein